MVAEPLISRWLRPGLVVVVSTLGGAMFLLVLAQVVFRYVLALPLAWSEELARYLMVWGVCLAAAEAYARGSHVGLTAFLDLLPPSARRYLKLFVHLVVIGLMALIVYHGFRFSLMLGDQESPAMGLPMTWPYLAVPVGAGLIFLQALALFIQELGRPPLETGACPATGPGGPGR
ncbi:MAG: TRAP transporter small permease [Thermodesulfobacteriota bacterium]